MFFMAKDKKNLQCQICCINKTRFESQIKDTGLTDAALLKLIISEYYSKVNTTYNKD